MIKRVITAIGIMATTLVVTSAYAALTYNGRVVSRVDITQSSAIFWIDGSITGFADCRPNATEYPVIACSLKDTYCDKVTDVALAAKLAGKKVEFEVKGCVGNFNKVNRFRMEP